MDTQQNVTTVRQQIEQKLNYNRPYYATPYTISPIQTDFDNFPYQRYYRGDYKSSTPIVLERETGWREWNNPCYRELTTLNVKPTSYCWQYPCSNVFPCNKKAYKESSESKPLKVNISP